MEELKEKIAEIERKHEVLETEYKKDAEKIQETLDRHCDRLKELEDKVEVVISNLNKRLPLWATIFITFLSSLCTGLIVATL